MLKQPTLVTNLRFAALVAAVCGVSSIFWGSDAQSPDQPPIATIGPAARIFAPPVNHRFPNGQTYVYAVEWHFLNAGIARVKMESAGRQQKVSANVDSLGVVNALYGIHDRLEAYFNPKTFCSQRVTKHTEEGSRKRDTHVQFDYANHKSLLDEKNLKNNQTRHIENDIPECVTDMITGFYYLASQPLQSGAIYIFPVNEGGKTTEVSAKVEARERIKVPAGRYQAVRLVAEPTTGPLKGKTKIAVWFSDDGERLPVQMKSKLGWGTLLFRLQRVEKQ
ncbi:MAG: hypothetical protein DMG70_15695 [Acidobacteria bacterium]|nr:MAG: hypothetical protein DMG70_15695 [Acidobacteriota bacterium]PYY07666.1 MAG: hypothetical protein DMG69_17830 [Acidobacteriota bacterium]